MSDIVRLPADMLILVCDARKALLLRNSGAMAQPELRIDACFESEIDQTEVGAAPSPGRRYDGGAAAVSGGSRSAMELPDPERKRAEEFAETIVSALTDKHRNKSIGGIVLVAPPSFLGILRQKMSSELSRLVRAEVAKELTEMPLPDMVKVLLKNL